MASCSMLRCYLTSANYSSQYLRLSLLTWMRFSSFCLIMRSISSISCCSCSIFAISSLSAALRLSCHQVIDKKYLHSSAAPRFPTWHSCSPVCSFYVDGRHPQSLAARTLSSASPCSFVFPHCGVPPNFGLTKGNFTYSFFHLHLELLANILLSCLAHAADSVVILDSFLKSLLLYFMQGAALCLFSFQVAKVASMCLIDCGFLDWVCLLDDTRIFLGPLVVTIE